MIPITIRMKRGSFGRALICVIRLTSVEILMSHSYLGFHTKTSAFHKSGNKLVFFSFSNSASSLNVGLRPSLHSRPVNILLLNQSMISFTFCSASSWLLDRVTWAWAILTLTSVFKLLSASVSPYTPTYLILTALLFEVRLLNIVHSAVPSPSVISTSAKLGVCFCSGLFFVIAAFLALLLSPGWGTFFLLVHNEPCPWFLLVPFEACQNGQFQLVIGLDVQVNHHFRRSISTEFSKSYLLLELFINGIQSVFDSYAFQISCGDLKA